MAYLNLENISFAYSEEKVIDRVSMQVQENSISSIIGSSGCGKSTLLRLIAGLEKPQSGNIWINNQQVLGSKINIPTPDRKVGIVFQDYHLFPHLNIWYNVVFGLKKSFSKIEVEEILELLSISDLRDKKPDELSGGQQQRVALARSLVCKPSLLLLDEPFSSLDNALRKEIRHEICDVLKKLKMTSLFVLHDVEDVMAISEHLFVMDKGQIIQSGSAKEVFTHPRHSKVAKLFGEHNVVLSDSLPHEIKSQLNLSKQAKFVGLAMDCFQISTQKEDIPAFLVDNYFNGKTNVLRFKIGDLNLQMIADELPSSEFRLNINENKIIYFNG